jgi:nickel/cobalt exporter
MPAHAHPLGNFTINHLAKVRPDSRGVTIRYVVDMAEIPTFAVMRERSITSSERARLQQWAQDEIGVVKSSLTVFDNGHQLSLSAREPKVSPRPGAGGLPTLYFVDDFRATFPTVGTAHKVAIDDRLYPGRIGWKDIVVAPALEPTNELRSYPNALLGSPRSVIGVVVSLTALGKVVALTTSDSAVSAPAGSSSQARSNVLSDMLARGITNPFFVLITLLLAIGLGALHALEPGHGKTLLAVSLVGARATTKQAFILAVALTLAHTAGVLALGVVLIVLAQWIVPENVYPWISLVSGTFVAVLGAMALSRYVKAKRGDSHSHGLEPHVHDHGRGGHQHDHAIPGATPLSFKSVVLIAMSGNVAPCPAALVVLLTALTLHQLAYGLLVVIAFSVGLAAVLTGLGIAVVHGASWLSNRRVFDRVTTYGPLVTATIICIIGAVMMGKSSASALQAPTLPVTLLVLAAIAGYAISPGHHHTHARAPLKEEAS